MKVSDIGFHEATVISFELIEGRCSICLEKVTLPDGSEADGCLVLEGCVGAEVDGIASSSWSMFASDGEIIFLECSDQLLTGAVQWNDFANRESVTKHYKIGFDSIRWKSR